MIDVFAAVTAFHKKFGHPAPTTATLDEFRPAFRAKLLVEEVGEFIEACGLEETDNDGLVQERPVDWVKAIDALWDVIYVAAGSLVEMGCTEISYFDETHRANMEKDANGPDGKPTKPPGWVGPRIAYLLRRRLAFQRGESGAEIEPEENA